MRITTGTGTYATGDAARWRLEIPSGIRLVGGRISGSAYTPNGAFALEVRTGSGGGARRTLLHSASASSFATPLVAYNDWVDVGLIADGSTRVTTAGGNSLRMSSVRVTLADSQAPTLVTNDADPLLWYGVGRCMSWYAAAADAGSGVTSLVVTAAGLTTPVASVAIPRRVGLKPGSPSSSGSGCVGATSMVHGQNVVTVTAADASGRSTGGQVRFRADLEPPMITGIDPTAERRAEPRPDLRLTVTDSDSGVESVTGSIDGVPAAVLRDGTHVSVTPTATLAVGEHPIVVTAADRAGATRTVRSVLHIADETPPTIIVHAPGSTGSPNPWIEAEARDAGSAVLPATWSVQVDGERVPVTPIGSIITGPLGTLVPGVHRITVEVVDTSGNRGRIEHSYTVTGAAGAEATVGGFSGVTVLATTPRIIHAGAIGQWRLMASRAGRPLGGWRVSLTGRSGFSTSAITDSRGIAVVRARISRPVGPLVARVEGSGLPTRTIPLRVAPRVHISTSTHHPHRGSAVTISGLVTPRRAGQRLQLQARIDDTWYPLRRSVMTDHRGRVTTTVSSAVRGAVAVRLRAPGRHGWSTTWSNVIVLRVT